MTPTSAPAPPPPISLPAPELLTGVLHQLADTSVPGAQKVGLVEGATADEVGQLDKFAKAMVDNGYAPLAFTASEITWSDTMAGNVTADITARSENPAKPETFTFPMEFKPSVGNWQLSRKTADLLLALGDAARPTAAPPR
uniref:LppK n=1 Tax=uncultured bacterium esnapd12 TaxID=1366592 RepID=S5UB81_9BACT|nr:LppK [uncultured bacterium esnapd12]